MKEEGKVRQITKKEAKQIDPTKVAYFTLNDGTVFIVKDNMKEKQNIEGKNIITENTNIQKGQEQIQIANEDNIQTDSQNNQEGLQFDSNIGYNISSEGENIQQNSCCKMNAKLINAQIIGKNQLNQQFPRRQLYKLIEAIPVRFCDVQGVQFMNQTNNCQINLQKFNNDTYIVDRSTGDNFSNYQANTNTHCSMTGKVCNCPGRIEKECCCPIGNPALREEMEIVSPEYVEQCRKMGKK